MTNGHISVVRREPCEWGQSVEVARTEQGREGHGRLVRARERTTLADVGVEAPARQGARSTHTGSM